MLTSSTRAWNRHVAACTECQARRPAGACFIDWECAFGQVLTRVLDYWFDIAYERSVDAILEREPDYFPG